MTKIVRGPWPRPDPKLPKWRKPAGSRLWFSVGPKSTKEPQTVLKVAIPWRK